MEAGEHSSVSTDVLQRPLMTMQDREGADPSRYAAISKTLAMNAA
jgi:hypothetical protein